MSPTEGVVSLPHSPQGQHLPLVGFKLLGSRSATIPVETATATNGKQVSNKQCRGVGEVAGEQEV